MFFLLSGSFPRVNVSALLVALHRAKNRYIRCFGRRNRRSSNIFAILEDSAASTPLRRLPRCQGLRIAPFALRPSPLRKANVLFGLRKSIEERLHNGAAGVWRKALVHGLGTMVAVYKAGVPITEAVDSAAASAGFFPVREGFRRIRERLEGGESIGDAFLAEKTFPEEVRESASVGAATGKLDEQLLHARNRLESEAKAKKGILLVILPILAFLLVACVIGYSVITQFYDMVLKPLDEAMK